MDRSDSQSPPQQAAESREPRQAAAAQPEPRVVPETREHTDMRFEPQLEEPGYGHGV
jgi:hypothetical protein